MSRTWMGRPANSDLKSSLTCRLWSDSMTKITSAQETSEPVSRRTALALTPRARTSKFAEREKMRSAVGLRHLLRLQMKRSFDFTAPPAPAAPPVRSPRHPGRQHQGQVRKSPASGFLPPSGGLSRSPGYVPGEDVRDAGRAHARLQCLAADARYHGNLRRHGIAGRRRRPPHPRRQAGGPDRRGDDGRGAVDPRQEVSETAASKLHIGTGRECRPALWAAARIPVWRVGCMRFRYG